MRETIDPNVDILHNSTSIKTSVLSYARSKNLCTIKGECTVTVKPNSGIDFNFWDEISIRDLSTSGVDALYFISSITKSPTEVILECQDHSKRLQDFFIDFPYVTDVAMDTKAALEYFLDLAGVSYNFNDIDSGELLPPQTSLGMAQCLDTVVSLLQQSGWYAHFDSEGVLQIYNVPKNESNSEGTIVAEEILNIVWKKHDSMLRNRVVVWGAGDPDTGDYIFADIDDVSPYQIDDNDIRTVVIENGNIENVETATEIANTVLSTLIEINEEIVLTTTAVESDTVVRELDIAKVFTIDADYLDFTGIVTAMEINYGPDGLIIVAELGRKCPKIFGYYNYPVVVPSGEITEHYDISFIHSDSFTTPEPVEFEDYYYDVGEGNVINILASGISIEGINSNPTIHTMSDNRIVNIDWGLPIPYYYKNFVYHITIKNPEGENATFIATRYDTTTQTETSISLYNANSYDMEFFSMYGYDMSIITGFFISDDGLVYLWSYNDLDVDSVLQVHLLDFDTSTASIVDTISLAESELFPKSVYYTKMVRTSDNTVVFFGQSWLTEDQIVICTFDMSTKGPNGILGKFSSTSTLIGTLYQNLTEYTLTNLTKVGDIVIFPDVNLYDATHADMTMYFYDLLTGTLHHDTFALPSTDVPYTLRIVPGGIIPSYSNNCVYMRVRGNDYRSNPYYNEVNFDRLYRFSLEHFDVLDYRSLESTDVLQHFYNDQNVYELHYNGELYDIINGTLIETITDPLFVNYRAQAFFCSRLDDSNNIYFCAPNSKMDYGLIYKYTLSTNSIALIADLEIHYTDYDDYGPLASEQLMFLPGNKLQYLAGVHYNMQYASSGPMTYILENS